MSAAFAEAFEANEDAKRAAAEKKKKKMQAQRQVPWYESHRPTGEVGFSGRFGSPFG